MNLTSLMDVFTILVFFLLVNSATTEVLETPKQITLPASVVEEKPRETVVIFVSPTEVTVQGEPVDDGIEDIVGDRTNARSSRRSAARLARGPNQSVIGLKTRPWPRARRSRSSRDQVRALPGGQEGDVDLHRARASGRFPSPSCRRREADSRTARRESRTQSRLSEK